MGKTSWSPLWVIRGFEPDCCLMYQVTEMIQGQRRKKYTEYGKFPSQKHHDYLKMKRGKMWLCSALQLVIFYSYLQVFHLNCWLSHPCLNPNWYHGFLIPKEQEIQGRKILEDKTHTLRNLKFCKTGKCRCLKLHEIIVF